MNVHTTNLLAGSAHTDATHSHRVTSDGYTICDDMASYWLTKRTAQAYLLDSDTDLHSRTWTFQGTQIAWFQILDADGNHAGDVFLQAGDTFTMAEGPEDGVFYASATLSDGTVERGIINLEGFDVLIEA